MKRESVDYLAQVQQIGRRRITAVLKRQELSVPLGNCQSLSPRDGDNLERFIELQARKRSFRAVRCRRFGCAADFRRSPQDALVQTIRLVLAWCRLNKEHETSQPRHRAQQASHPSTSVER
jgi:hypothetical protein